MKKPELLVVPTTHWDRAWYWAFERFRIKLIDVFNAFLKEMKKHPDYTFTLDGQTIPLDDFLEVFPEKRELLKKYAKEGRLKTGPLYVLSDLYCTGGEALIRNLQIGMSMGREIGAGQEKTLYLPDTFGITPSIPMIAEGFDIPVFSFMRGTAGAVPEESRMFIWKTPDGSSVRVFRLRDGYANAARLGHDPDFKALIPRIVRTYGIEKLKAAAEKQLDGDGGPYLLLAGVDHQIPQKELDGFMKAVNKRSDFKLKYSHLDELARQLVTKSTRKLFSYTGEFHGTGAGSVLGGTVSSRIYLKQANAEAERELVSVAETGDAFTALLGIGTPHGRALQTAWKHLLKVHPHDNITGCSVDQVHRDDEYAISQAKISADAVRRRMVRTIAEEFGGQKEGDTRYGFYLINMQGTSRTVMAAVQCDFEGRDSWGDTVPPRSYRIVNEKGKEIPFREISRQRSVEHPHPVLFIELAPKLKPFTVERFFIEPVDSLPLSPVRGNTISNKRLKITVDKKGTVTIRDKKTKKSIRNGCYFTVQKDVGDTYNFRSDPENPEQVISLRNISITSAHGCSGMESLRIKGKIPVPDYTKGKGTILLPCTVTASLTPESSTADFRIDFENYANDFRLRFNVPVSFSPKKTVAGLKFNTVSRPVRSSIQPKKDDTWVEPLHPADHFVSCSGPGSGTAVFSEFPFNYELVTGHQKRLAVTLLRAVGFLSRTGAGPDTLTPEAQCHRSFSMRFGIRPFSTSEEAKLFSESISWRTPVFFGLIEGYDKPIQKTNHGPFIKVSPSYITVSAFKRGLKGGKPILRLFNPTGKVCRARLSFRNILKVTPCSLAEVPRKKSIKPDKNGNVVVEMKPFGLSTCILERTKLKK